MKTNFFNSKTAFHIFKYKYQKNDRAFYRKCLKSWARVTVGPGSGLTRNRHFRTQKGFNNPHPLHGDQVGGSTCTQTASIRQTAGTYYRGKICFWGLLLRNPQCWDAFSPKPYYPEFRNGIWYCSIYSLMSIPCQTASWQGANWIIYLMNFPKHTDIRDYFVWIDKYVCMIYHVQKAIMLTNDCN